MRVLSRNLSELVLKRATSRMFLGFLVQTILKLVPGNLTLAQHYLPKIMFGTSKERYNLNFAKRKQTTAINIDCLKAGRNNLKSLALIFQVSVIHFHPGDLQPLTLANGFGALI